MHETLGRDRLAVILDLLRMAHAGAQILQLPMLTYFIEMSILEASHEIKKPMAEKRRRKERLN